MRVGRSGRVDVDGHKRENGTQKRRQISTRKTTNTRHVKRYPSDKKSNIFPQMRTNSRTHTLSGHMLTLCIYLRRPLHAHAQRARRVLGQLGVALEALPELVDARLARRHAVAVAHRPVLRMCAPMVPDERERIIKKCERTGNETNAFALFPLKMW